MSISALLGQQASLSGIIQCAGWIPCPSPVPGRPPGSLARTQERVLPCQACLPLVCTAPVIKGNLSEKGYNTRQQVNHRRAVKMGHAPEV